MPISLGLAAQDLRKRLHLSLREAAVELGVSYVHLCNIENAKASPSPEILEKFHEAWGIDLYMYALAFFPGDRDIPKPLRAPIKALATEWKSQIDRILRQRSKEGSGPCLIWAD